jgi:hypothetical protein
MPTLESSSVVTGTDDRAPASVVPREFALLLACCSAGAREWREAELSRLLEAGCKWSRILELGEHHGVLPLVYQSLCDSPTSVPSEVLEELASRYDQNVRRNLRFTAELFRILDCLASAGILAIPHKGPVLAQTVYGDLALRDFSDLDVLVPREEARRAKEALRTLGYIPPSQLSAAHERAYLSTGYEYTFDGPAGRNLLEIQWDIVPHFYAVEFPMRELFARVVPTELAGRTVKTLAPEDLFLTLCVHAAKHAWIRLCWLRDIAGVAMTQNLDWSVVAGRAGELGLRRIVGVSLTLAQRLLQPHLPEVALNSFRADREIESLCSEIVAHIPAAEEYSTESPAYFKLMLRLRERAGDKLRFASRLLLTPSVGEWHLVSLPAPLFPLYRVVRLLRLVKRLAGQSSNKSL